MYIIWQTSHKSEIYGFHKSTFPLKLFHENKQDTTTFMERKLTEASGRDRKRLQRDTELFRECKRQYSYISILNEYTRVGKK